MKGIIFKTLPATPYFKMIDIWLFFSMNLMVLSLIFHTYLENIVGKETDKQVIRYFKLWENN